MSAVADRLTIKSLHPLFVAEVTGVDLTSPLSPTEFRALWDAFNEHEILVFREQALDDESQMAFSRQFGELERMEAHAANDWKPGHIAIMTNLDASGAMLPLDHPGMIHRERNEAWHTDSSFKPVGALASLLHARIVPPAGGNTEFATCRGAYRALPEAKQRELDPLQVIHRVTKPDDVDEDAYSEEQKKRLTVVHPLVRTNPANGRKNLYVGAHAQEIIGMPREAGKALLAELTAFCTQPQFVYSHAWQEGDLVMWDNRCALHRATPFDKTLHRRKLHRTTVAGTVPESVLAAPPQRLQTA